MSLLRAESRTPTSWHRFDRIAALISILLLLTLGVISLFRAGVLGPLELPTAAGPLARADVEQSAAVSSAENASLSDATGTESDGTEPAGALSQDAAASEAGTVEAADNDPNPTEVVAAASANDDGVDGTDGAKDPAQNTVSKQASAPTDEARANEPAAAEAKAGQSESTMADASKSLASQDPATQATFERIPININKSISANPDQADGADKLNPILELRAAGGRLTIEGIVSDDEVRGAILRGALETYGMRNLTDRLTVNPAVARFPWADEAQDLMVLMGESDDDSSLRIDGESIALGGEVSDLPTKQARALAAQQLFGTTARIANRVQVQAPASIMVADAKQASQTSRSDSPVVLVSDTPADASTDEEKQSSAATGKPIDDGETVTAMTGGEEPDEVSAKPPAQSNTKDEPDAKIASDAKNESDSPTTDKNAANTGADKPVQVAMAKPSSGTDDTPAAESAGPQASDSESAGETLIAKPRAIPDQFKTADCAKIATGLRIPFASGSSKLTEDGRQILDAVQTCLKRRRYVVGGHTDSQGSSINNLILSQSRAQSAVDYLVSRGVPKTRLVPRGYGESRPIAANGTPEGRALNRRIDFRFDR